MIWVELGIVVNISIDSMGLAFNYALMSRRRQNFPWGSKIVSQCWTRSNIFSYGILFMEEFLALGSSKLVMEKGRSGTIFPCTSYYCLINSLIDLANLSNSSSLPGVKA